MSGQRRSGGLSESGGFAHIGSYLRSGLRPSEYYRSVDISEHQFYTWHRRYGSVHPELFASKLEPSDGEERFHQVQFEHAPSSTPLLGGLEIHCSHGVKAVICTGSGLDRETFVSLIKLKV